MSQSITEENNNYQNIITNQASVAESQLDQKNPNTIKYAQEEKGSKIERIKIMLFIYSFFIYIAYILFPILFTINKTMHLIFGTNSLNIYIGFIIFYGILKEGFKNIQQNKNKKEADYIKDRWLVTLVSIITLLIIFIVIPLYLASGGEYIPLSQYAPFVYFSLGMLIVLDKYLNIVLTVDKPEKIIIAGYYLSIFIIFILNRFLIKGTFLSLINSIPLLLLLIKQLFTIRNQSNIKN
jgi:hypothetical protein